MIRSALLAPFALALAMPATAQDHSAHTHHDHAAHGGHAAKPAPEPQAMDHCAMGHLPPDQCPPRDDHAGHVGPMDRMAPGAAPETALPPRALEGPRHAADAI